MSHLSHVGSALPHEVRSWQVHTLRTVIHTRAVQLSETAPSGQLSTPFSLDSGSSKVRFVLAPSNNSGIDSWPYTFRDDSRRVIQQPRDDSGRDCSDTACRRSRLVSDINLPQGRLGFDLLQPALRAVVLGQCLISICSRDDSVSIFSRQHSF